MQTVQRTDSKAETLWVIIKFVYYFLALPCLVFISIAMAFIAYGTAVGKTAGADSQFYSVAVLVWLATFVPLAVRRYGKVLRHRSLKQMVAMLSSPDRFSPQTQHQVLDAGRGKYLGIDTQHGTILYIHIVKKGVIDVIGLDMQSWTNRELEGSALRLYTRQPDLPVLSVYAHSAAAKELFDTLGAMSHNTYANPFMESWPVYVSQQSRFVEYEHNVVVPQAV